MFEKHFSFVIDVASRGLDVNKASYVFNYDFPPDMEEYVYRFSMTGMQGKMGESISLLAEGDWRYAEELVGILVPDWLGRESKPCKAWKERKERKDQENVTYVDADIIPMSQSKSGDHG